MFWRSPSSPARHILLSAGTLCVSLSSHVLHLPVRDWAPPPQDREELGPEEPCPSPGGPRFTC